MKKTILRKVLAEREQSIDIKKEFEEKFTKETLNKVSKKNDNIKEVKPKKKGE